jgi:beta-galactosidase
MKTIVAKHVMHRLAGSAVLLALAACVSGAAVPMPSTLPGEWNLIGRTKVQTADASATIQGGYVVHDEILGDAKISFRARAPLGTDQVQIWGGFRYRDRDSRYVFALRGGNDNDVYLARYAPDGGIKFLGFTPLDFKPVPGTWYQLRVVTLGKRIQIYLGDETLPRINVVDESAAWTNGKACLGGGWLPVEFADFQAHPLTAEETAKLQSIGNKKWALPAVDKEARRQQQRAAYQPVKVAAFGPLRTEIPLNGDWLFLPDYQLKEGEAPTALEYDDSFWHVMEVPSFWTPGLSWLHGETGFPGLGGVAETKGVADSLYVQETARCSSYTFDWRKTKSAWYREYVDLPAGLGNRRFELTFDAIAKVSDVWVNGVRVGHHTGMFGQLKCDVTAAVKPGRNVIVVHVLGNIGGKTSNHVEGVAVTVEVTSAMLNSLPHGMFQDGTSGIWQPVKLTVTSPVVVSDSFIEPGLHGADINLDILNTRRQSVSPGIDYSIISAADGELLYSNHVAQTVDVAAGETGHVRFSTAYLNPQLWSPQEPNLYYLQVWLRDGDQVIDAYKTRFGFRTFAVEGAKFLLNGHPYWLRGANPFPNTLRPNDAALAHRFMELAKAGNVAVTRSHIVPFTSTWLDAADETGMGVSFEGTWPWLMLSGNPPDPELLKAWKEEYLSLIREHRNHPSILLWTVNNEMKFPVLEPDPDVLKQKWFILDDMIKSMRQLDPTRPIVADSSYVRKEAAKSYETVVKPNHLDDGDVDDRHAYFGWYNPTFFHFYDGQLGKESATPGRPLISQEMATGYPNNDDGHPVRFYLFKNYTPQALVGDDAYENADPAIFLERQAFMTKELAETFRRTEHETGAGVLYFSYFTWFTAPWSVEKIQPQAGYYALQAALQPVLVSAELYGRHFYAGKTVKRRVCIINDAEDFDAIPASQLAWKIKAGDTVLARGQAEVPPVEYYGNQWLSVDFTMPQNLPAPRVDAQLILSLQSRGHILSTNHYDIVLADSTWTEPGEDGNSKINFVSPDPQASEILSGWPGITVTSLEAAAPTNLLIVGDLGALLASADAADKLKAFIAQGGNVLLLHPGDSLATLFPERIKAFTKKDGEIVTMHVPESPVFAGIEPLDLAWFERGNRQLPIACSGVYQIKADEDTIALADQLDLHGYLQKASDLFTMGGTPLVELRLGKGRVLASEMNLESGQDDPIARRLLVNMISYLETARPD